MEKNAPILLPDVHILREIRKERNASPERLETQTECFKMWLKSESHLPDVVDEQLIQNILRAYKCDLEKSKIGFERFLASRTKLKKYYLNRCFDETYFNTFSVHRSIVLSPLLTSKGYRTIFIRYPENPDDFDFEQYVNYLLLLMDYILHDDIAAGYVYVCDQKNFTTQHLSKFNVKTTLQMSNIIANIYPHKIKKLHLIHLPRMADILVNITKRVLNAKLRKRFVDHRYPSDLIDFLPCNILPREYGGVGKDLDEQGEDIARYFIKNRNWFKKVENLELAGPVPANKTHLYYIEEFEREESYKLVL